MPRCSTAPALLHVRAAKALRYKKLTFRHQGLDARLTDVAGKVVAGLIA